MVHWDRSEKVTSKDVRIGDFGLSLVFSSPFARKVTSKCGTKIYMSPEQLSNKSYGKVDLCYVACGYVRDFTGVLLPSDQRQTPLLRFCHFVVRHGFADSLELGVPPKP